MEAQQNRKQKMITYGILAAVLLALVVAAVIYAEPLFALFQDQKRTQEIIQSAGPWGPAVFMLLQIVQVFVAPIPGQVIGFAGGYLFGAFWGTVYGMIGAAIGFTLVFLLARKLGRPFVELFVDKKLLKKFDYLAESKGVFVFFLIFLIPALPDDIICFIAGLTTIKIRTLILISLIGRLPGYLVLSLAGAGVATSDTRLVITLVVIAVAASVLAIWQRARIERFIKKLEKDSEKKNK